jgi:hypothetical protein
MPQDDNILDLDSSSESETLDAGQAQATTEGAESSVAQDATESDGLLSVVRDVVDKDVEPTAEAASSAEGSETGREAGVPDSKEPDNENFSDVPFHKHPRFQQLLAQTKTFKADAERYQNVQGFLDQHGLQAAEAADALLVAGLAKTNPAQAWEQIRPWVQNLLRAAGEVLPDDLQSRVTNGEMSPEAAREVSRSRAQVQSYEARTAFDQQRAERSSLEAQARALVDTATAWETDRQTKDPNFAAKLPALQREIAWLHTSEGRPTSPQGVQDQLKRAYDAVNKTFVPPVPPQRRQALRPVVGGQQSAGASKPVMNSTLDIVRAITSKAS